MDFDETDNGLSLLTTDSSELFLPSSNARISSVLPPLPTLSLSLLSGSTSASASSPLSGSSLSASSSSSNLTARSRRVRKYANDEIRHAARLEDHRRYDMRRQSRLQKVLKQLKQSVLHSQQMLHKQRSMLNQTEEDTQSELWRTGSPQTELECPADAADAAAAAAAAAESLTDRNVDLLKSKADNTRGELFERSVKIIRKLQYAKQMLETRLEQFQKEDETTQHTVNGPFVTPESRQRLSKRGRSTEPIELSDIDTLKHAISVVQQYYATELASVNRLSQCVLIHELSSSVLDEFCIIGLDGRIAAAVRWTPASRVLSENFSLSQRRRALDRCRAATLVQLHSLCYLLTHRFHYQAECSICNEPQSKRFLMSLQNSEEEESKESMLNMFQACAKANNAFRRRSISDQAIPVPVSVDLSDSQSTDTHPLHPLALPSDAFAAMQEMLASLAQNGKEDYEQKILQLYPLAFGVFPTTEPLQSALPVRFSSDSTAHAAKDAVYHPVSTPSYETIYSLYELYCGKKPLVTLTILIPSATENAMYMDVDVFFLLNPQTNLPIAHIFLPRRQYDAGQSYRLVEHNAIQRIGHTFQYQQKQRLSQQKNELQDQLSSPLSIATVTSQSSSVHSATVTEQNSVAGGD